MSEMPDEKLARAVYKIIKNVARDTTDESTLWLLKLIAEFHTKYIIEFSALFGILLRKGVITGEEYETAVREAEARLQVDRVLEPEMRQLQEHITKIEERVRRRREEWREWRAE